MFQRQNEIQGSSIKAALYISKGVDQMKIRRGDIFVTDLESVGENVGSEQSSKRPAVIIQNDTGNEYSPTTIVAFITTKNKHNIPTHVRLHTSRLYYPSIALLEQIRTISKERLVKYIGTLSDSEMEKIVKALCISLGIDRKDKK